MATAVKFQPNTWSYDGVWDNWIQMPTYSTIVATANTGYPRRELTWSTATVTSNNVVWPMWMANANTATIEYDWYDENNAPYNHQVWTGWVADDEASRARHDELQARREQNSRERLAAQQARMEQAITARSAAMELLESLLTPDEAEFKRRYGKIEVFGSDGCLYWLELHRETVHGNIVRVDEHGCILGRACVAPRMYDEQTRGALPTADGWVGQYLGLKFDAEQFLSHANWSQLYRCTDAAA